MHHKLQWEILPVQVNNMTSKCWPVIYEILGSTFTWGIRKFLIFWPKIWGGLLHEYIRYVVTKFYLCVHRPFSISGFHLECQETSGESCPEQAFTASMYSSIPNLCSGFNIHFKSLRVSHPKTIFFNRCNNSWTLPLISLSVWP